MFMQHGKSAAQPVPADNDTTTKVLNTAFIETAARSISDHGTELYQLVQTPAYKAIAEAVRSLARSQGMSEKDAAETVIDTFRKVDKIWKDFVFSEGIKRLKSSR
jgi:hypothetical protein